MPMPSEDSTGQKTQKAEPVRRGLNAFKNGTRVNWCQMRKNKKKTYPRIRISAGPQRGQYVDRIILKAKLGREILPGMEVEHLDGNSLNIDPCNLTEVTRPENNYSMWQRRKKEK